MSERSLEPSAGSGNVQTPGESSTRVYDRDFWLVFTSTFSINSANYLFVLLPIFIVRLGGRASTIGAVIGTASMAALLSRPIAGAAVERSRRRTAMCCLVLDAIAVALYIPLRSLAWPIYGVAVFNGAAGGTARVALFAMVYDIIPSGRQGEAMALFSLSGQLPSAFAPLLGVAIIRRFGFPAFFLTASALCLIGATASFMVRSSRSPAVKDSGARRSEQSVSYRKLITDPMLMPLWIVTFLFGIAIYSRVSFVAPFAEERGIGNVGWYFTIYAIVATCARLSGKLLDRFGLERMAILSLITTGIGIGLVSLTGEYHMLYVAAAVAGLGHGFVYPAISALVIRYTESGAMGRSSTVYTSVWDLSAMTAPYLLGIIATLVGYAPMFVIAGGFGVLAATYMTIAGTDSLRRRLA